jgi:hypothetical protein
MVRAKVGQPAKYDKIAAVLPKRGWFEFKK